MNTILSGSAGAISVYIIKESLLRYASVPQGYQIISVCCGLLAGLVSGTAACNNIHQWAAIIIGFVGGFVYILGCIFLYKFRIDDPVETIQVHGFCGAWGVLAVGIFDMDRGVIFSGNIRFLGI
jgi:Amt family ammonium transporter